MHPVPVKQGSLNFVFTLVMLTGKYEDCARGLHFWVLLVIGTRSFACVFIYMLACVYVYTYLHI